MQEICYSFYFEFMNGHEKNFVLESDHIHLKETMHKYFNIDVKYLRYGHIAKCLSIPGVNENIQIEDIYYYSNRKRDQR